MAQTKGSPGGGELHPRHHITLAPLTHLALAGVTAYTAAVGLDSSVNVVLQATLCLLAGCWRSLKSGQPEETMTTADAMRFPLVGSAVLLSLFAAIRYIGKDVANKVLAFYFLFLGAFSVSYFLAPFLGRVLPGKLRERTFLFSLPRVPLLSPEPEPVALDLTTLAMLPAGAAVAAWYALGGGWLSNNALGVAFSVVGIEEISIGSTLNGVVLLCGLFVYDVFWVFFTPVMVSVAKGLDAPIKLLFPRPGVDPSDPRSLALLGLGDIVIPGLFLALLLRFDFRRAGEDPRRLVPKYFGTGVAGYVAGLVATVVVMVRFKAAQPALLYLVPGVLVPVFGVAAASGDLSALWGFSEEAAPREGEGGGEGAGGKKDE